jgi:hypothetical protein
MHVGMATIFQNPQQRYTDYQVYRDELRLADQAELLGYQSIWGVEHHFTDYTMCPDVIQFLSYLAGRTQWIQLGSAVVGWPEWSTRASDWTWLSPGLDSSNRPSVCLAAWSKATVSTTASLSTNPGGTSGLSPSALSKTVPMLPPSLPNLPKLWRNWALGC